MKYEDGEFINLYWDGEPDTYHVRGHVDEATFRAALASYHGDAFFYGEPDKLELRHAYAFFGLNGQDGFGNVDRTLRECEARRGAFKVTVWDVPSERERDQKALAKLNARVQHRHIRLKYGSEHEGTTWPWPWTKGPFNDHIDPAHKARYAPETLTKQDAMELAGIADAYTTLISHGAPGFREHLRELHVAYDLWCRGVLTDVVVSEAGRTVPVDVRISTIEQEALADRVDDQAGGGHRGDPGSPEQDAGL